MARSSSPLFASDEGWPYPDGRAEPALDDDIDLDALELRADPHAFDTLTPQEYEVLSRRFGLCHPETSMKELSRRMGCTRAETRALLGGAIDKLRTRLSAP
ncbi:MAG: sigma factor-like helix-turn-helix DNA-binding protein [Acidimicrobiia bacterium]